MSTLAAGHPALTSQQPDMRASPSISVDDGSDPFLSASASSSHHRFSHFDNQLFALGPATSPDQAKRALEAHLAETERRIQDASKLGTTLVQQRKDLAERLKDVEKQQNEGDIGPELRQKLVEIEREYNNVGRETARAFLPKSRVSSNELGGSPFVSERSASPVKFESQAISSPSKMAVPNRKQRNQPSNRVHDIEFATEISTSLLSQVRHLQALLSEKEEALKTVTTEKSRLEVEAEGFAQRLRELDESEHRYKDENWNLETQIHEHLAAAKESADREKKLTQNLNILQLEKSTAQKELDEIKLSHARLTEDHTSALKLHDVELGSAKRSMVIAENERGALQRRVEDLVGQNQELAKAVATQRGRIEDREQARGLSEEDLETAPDSITPEHSPPPSPVKGTPRHSMLETETLKSSLHHAHRMIQNLKGNIHREKTEKLELKRMLQDARDEIDTKRSELGSANGKRNRRMPSKEFKKPLRPGHLGAARGSRSEIFVEDTNWEEEIEQQSPSRPATRPSIGAAAGRSYMSQATDSSDHFDTANETANETSDAGFETANEQRGTETEDFQTGVEDLSGSDDLTETEGAGAGGTIRMKKPSALSLRKAGDRTSFQSTASNSDEYTYEEAKTPTASQPQRMRLKLSRGGNRRSRVASEEPTFQDSPASITNSSNNGTPQPGGQSLFAELGDLGGSDDDDSISGTPSRQSLRSKSATPASRPSTARTAIPSPHMSPVMTASAPRPAMVDSGMMTEAWEPEPSTSPSAVPYLEGAAAAGVAGASLAGAAHMLGSNRDSTETTDTAVEAPRSEAATQWHDEQLNDLLKVDSLKGARPISTYSDMSSQYEPEMTETLAEFPSPPRTRRHTPMGSLYDADPLKMSNILSEHIEPEVAAHEPLVVSEILSEHVEPELAKDVRLSLSSIQSEHVEPKFRPREPWTYSAILSAHVVPMNESKESLTLSEIQSEHVAPVYANRYSWTLSEILSESIEPIEPEYERPATSKALPIPIPVASPELLPAPLTLSSIYSEHVEPEVTEVQEITPDEPESPIIPVTLPAFKPLMLSSIYSEHVEPEAIDEPEAPAPASLAMSSIFSEHIEPEEIEEPASPVIEKAMPALPSLVFSSISSVDFEPIEPPSPQSDSLVILGDETDEEAREEQETPTKPGFLGSVFGWKKDKPLPVPIIAEDDTREQMPVAVMSESENPLKAISNNAAERSPKKPRVEMSDESSQTAITSEQIDSMLKSKKQGLAEADNDVQSPPRGAVVVPSALRVRKSQDSIGSTGRTRKTDTELLGDANPLRRPGSSGSHRNSFTSHPPLPTDHKQVIAAAAQRTGSSSGGQGTMGPPLLPASAYKNPTFRPRTPNSQAPTSPIRSGTTPRAIHSSGTGHGTADIYSLGGNGNRSRATSLSSFASEVDTRFNLRNGMQMPPGLESSTDPRMINAITQTMIGEYLWKYTRKAGRGGMSDNRHRRYFWVHPYTKTLYWSDRDPSTGGRAEAKAKSVSIQGVRVVTDDNPMPPGLHRKSLIILTPGRSVKFTAVTGQRHETWFNALAYLLLRSGEEQVGDTVDVANGLTKEDVAEFNPGYRSNSSRAGAASVSSYNSRATRHESPMKMERDSMSSQPPHLVPNSASRPSMGTFSRLSSYWKPGDATKTGSFASRKTRVSLSGSASIYEASEVHDSAEDLREMIERQDRESDRLENVRACCDGKHDVGHLHHQHTAKGRNSTTPNKASGSQRPGASSRNQSRNSVRRTE
ncbi:anucleate primary sterigmata protein a [Phlyctema vagabunda]|uniref:Anucleate primary sterigmata protein a n=1 Tax=Phlyctema vagabunda TaxID=108571 RepID=A0ABR4P1E1_9HELO